MEKKKAIFRTEFDIEFHHLDLVNKIYSEKHTKDVYLFGIRISHKHYDRKETLATDKNKIGFGK